MDLISAFKEITVNCFDKTALIDLTGNKISYQELDRYSSQIAYWLTQKGLPSNRRIGIIVPRSYDTIAVMLATMKCGCTYVPLSPDLPKKRIADVIRKANLELLITNNEVGSSFPVSSIVNLDLEREAMLATDAASFVATANINQPANIIFTSGTIAAPKGVFISQQGILNLVRNQNYARISSADVLLQLSPFEFDGATLEMWGTLLNGAALVLMPPGYPVLSLLASKIEQYRVSLLFITTQLFNLMVDNRLSALDQVKTILTGGEQASARHMRRFIQARRVNTYLANIYGPAECTTFSTFYPVKCVENISDSDVVPIGQAINGGMAVVVDEQGHVVENNITGELMIGGVGVSAGYLDEQSLSQKKFIQQTNQQGEIHHYYLTGDKVYKNDEGDVVFVGRYDNEIKVRGYRILPDEIEQVAMQYPAVVSSALLISDRGDQGKYSELFITVGTDDFCMAHFKTFLKQEMPGYMQVNRVRVLPAMPLRQNGKIDYTALVPKYSGSEVNV